MIIQCRIATYFNAETQRRRVRRGSWSSELESGREFLATKNRRSRRCQELELESGVVERSWRWSGSPSERIRRIRRGSARRSFRPPPTSRSGEGLASGHRQLTTYFSKSPTASEMASAMRSWPAAEGCRRSLSALLKYASCARETG